MKSQFESASASPGFLLWHATLRWQRLMASTLKEHGLTHGQFVLLTSVWWLVEHSGPPSQRDVAAHAGTDAMMTSQVLRALEDRRYVTRQADATDARVKRLQLTDAGAAVLRGALPAVEAADQAFFAAVLDQAALVTALGVLADSVLPG